MLAGAPFVALRDWFRADGASLIRAPPAVRSRMLMFQLRLEFAFDCAAAPGDTKACRNGIASNSTGMEPGVATENLKVVEVPTFEDPLASFGDDTVPASARVMAFAPGAGPPLEAIDDPVSISSAWAKFVP